MKRAFLVFLSFFMFARLTEAHLFSPPGLEGVARSDTVYLVRIASVKEGKATFSITEVLTGKPISSLVLTPYEYPDFKKGTEWILVHNPSGFKDCVGWASKGDCEWLPIGVTRDGDKATAQWIGPLDKVREYLKQHPHKP